MRNDVSLTVHDNGKRVYVEARRTKYETSTRMSNKEVCIRSQYE